MPLLRPAAMGAPKVTLRWPIGGEVYACKPTDRVIWRFAITVVFTLASMSVTSSVVATISDVTASGGAGAVSKVPFSIDTSEVEGGTALSSGLFDFDWYSLGRQTSGVYPLARELSENYSIVRVTLTLADGSIAAEDLLILGVKETLIFNARTNALAGVINAAEAYGATVAEQIAIYGRAENHPQLTELEAIYRNAKGWPDDKAISERASEIKVIIAFDLMEKLRETQGD